MQAIFAEGKIAKALCYNLHISTNEGNSWLLNMLMWETLQVCNIIIQAGAAGWH